MSYYIIAVLVLKIQLLSLQPCEGVLLVVVLPFHLCLTLGVSPSVQCRLYAPELFVS